MNVSLKCFAQLSRYLPADASAYALAPGATVGQVIADLGVPPDELKLIFVNGCKAGLDTELKEGDRLGLFPAVGGG